MATKKEFVALATALHRARPERANAEVYAAWELTANEVRNALRDTSERFDEDRFLRAAGVIDDE